MRLKLSVIRHLTAPALTAALAGIPAVAVLTAAPAQACTHNDDVNTLCSNEQTFVNDLAKVGIVPTQSPRGLVNQGWQLCGQLGSGVPRDVIVQKVYGSASMHLDQAQAIVASAINNLCQFSSAPGPSGRTATQSVSYLAGLEIGKGTQQENREVGAGSLSPSEVQETCQMYASGAATFKQVYWHNQTRTISASEFNPQDYLRGCLDGMGTG